MESVLFTTPFLWVLYGIALFLNLYDLIKKATGYVLTIISVLTVVCTTVYALLLGASVYEAASVILLFLAINLLSFTKLNGGRDE